MTLVGQDRLAPEYGTPMRRPRRHFEAWPKERLAGGGSGAFPGSEDEAAELVDAFLSRADPQAI